MQKSIYFGGDILTMQEGALYGDAILTQDGVVRALGTYEQLAAAHPDAQPVDLHGATLMPSFLDSHSHITAFAETLGLVRLEGVGCFEDIVGRIADYKERHRLTDTDWILSSGYDHNMLVEKQHPTRHELDESGLQNPILVTHHSGELGVMNTAALSALSITAETSNPKEGHIGREKDGRTPNGRLENGALSFFSSQIPEPSLTQKLALLEEAQRIYLSCGITTVQDGLTTQSGWNLLKAAAEEGRLLLDTVCYPDMQKHKDIALEESYLGQYNNRLKIGGYKIVLDGSLQTRTAWMSEPYEGSSDGYCGEPAYNDETVRQLVSAAHKENLQLLAHCNGDAAAEQFLCALEAVAGQGADLMSARPVMIHAQTVKAGQLARMAELGVIPSFFVIHTHYWGDLHLQNLGMARAGRMDPARTAAEKGVVFTFHQDTPVLPPNMIDTIWCAVNRTTKSGLTLGEGEKVTALQAIKAVTANAAIQCFEETRKGTIQEGALADFVVLDRNPLQTPPLELREIRVLKTIKEDHILYQRQED